MSVFKAKAAFDSNASVKDMDMKLGIVTGYFASFNTLDADNDIILPGAFAKTIAAQGPQSSQPRIKYLLDHDTSKAIGVIQVLREDAKGLYYESKVGSNATAIDFLKMVDSGLITEHSFGYGVVKKTVVNPDADWRDQTTQLIEVKMWEGSPLQCWGANQNTPLTGAKAMKRIPLLLKAIDDGKFTDETFGILKDELIMLETAFKNISSNSTKQIACTVCNTNNDDDIDICTNCGNQMKAVLIPDSWKDAIQSFNNSLKN